MTRRHPLLRLLPWLFSLAAWTVAAYILTSAEHVTLVLVGMGIGALAAATSDVALYLSRLLALPSPGELARLTNASTTITAPPSCPACGSRLLMVGGTWCSSAMRNLGQYRCFRYGHGWREESEPLAVEVRFERWREGDRRPTAEERVG